MSRKSGRARALVPVVGSPSLLILLVVAPGVGMRSPGAGGHMGAPPRPALLHALPLPSADSQVPTTATTRSSTTPIRRRSKPPSTVSLSTAIVSRSSKSTNLICIYNLYLIVKLKQKPAKTRTQN
jgi:hypothetical protein